MACPICDHTMQNLGIDEKTIFWCSRCGTLKEGKDDSNNARIETTIWTRNIIEAAKLSKSEQNVMQSNNVEMIYKINYNVHQRDLQEPMISMNKLDKTDKINEVSKV